MFGVKVFGLNYLHNVVKWNIDRSGCYKENVHGKIGIENGLDKEL